jgi:signal transduction histidine kinase
MDLSEFARSVTQDFSKSAAELGYSIDFDSHGGPVPVHADREALGRALWNLLDNAVKYSPEHKTIQVQVAGDANNATLSVSDHGLGILPQEREAIFTRFVRGAAARERNIRGTGIGLAMARATLEAHGGTIEVESAPGKGSTFTIVLPAGSKAPALHRGTANDQNTGG